MELEEEDSESEAEEHWDLRDIGRATPEGANRQSSPSVAQNEVRIGPSDGAGTIGAG